MGARRRLVDDVGGGARGSVVATCRASGDDDVVLTEVAAVERASTDALLARLDAEPVAAGRRSRAMWDHTLEPLRRRREQYYVRLPDVRAVLERSRPAFTARLHRRASTVEGRDAVIYPFGRHYRMAITARGWPRAGGSADAGTWRRWGVWRAPDALAALLTGPLGMHGAVRPARRLHPAGDAGSTRPSSAADRRPADLVPPVLTAEMLRVTPSRGRGGDGRRCPPRGRAVDDGDVDLLGEDVLIVTSSHSASR